MKLTKLYIHNYKSFYDTTIELDKLNIVVGENNSGKSNLIDVLEFIDIAMSKDIERAIDDKGGYDKIKNYSAVGEEKVVVRATYHYDINSHIKFKNIDKRMISERKGYIIVSFSFTKKYSILSECRPSQYVTSHKEYFNKNKEDIKKTFVFSTKNKRTIELFRFHIQYQLSTYYFDPQKIRTLSNQDSKYNELLKDGSNLGKVLFEIKEKDKNRFEIISNSLISTVNEIDGIELYNVAGNYIIAFKERGREPIPVHVVSDGTINFLATMTALNQDINSSLLVFEEPERHLHLNAITYMLQAFRESKKQIIITTHSTEIIKYADLKEIIFIYRDSDGDTQSIRADAIPNLRRKMKRLAYERDVTLDELIGEGMIGTFK